MPSAFEQRQVRLNAQENMCVIEEQTTWTWPEQKKNK